MSSAGCVWILLLTPLVTTISAISPVGNLGQLKAPESGGEVSEARGGSYGGGYGGSSGYGGYGGYGHGSITMDPVSILSLLSLGAFLIRSILNLLNNSSARSIQVDDIDLPLEWSDIPQAISQWQQNVGIIRERRESPDDLLQLFRTDAQCRNRFLCEYWARNRLERSENIEDLLLLLALGDRTSGAIYDRIAELRAGNEAEFCVNVIQYLCPIVETNRIQE